jgi:sugar-specific transcriptional regulator TrmB
LKFRFVGRNDIIHKEPESVADTRTINLKVDFDMELAMEKSSDLMRIYDEKTEAWKFITKDTTVSQQLSTIEETLSRFGLLKNEIKVYLYLARNGEKKAGEIAAAISLHRTETYRILRELEKKGMLFSIFGKPLKFIPVSLDKAIDLLVDAQKMRINMLEKEKTNLLELWQSIPQTKVETKKKELFQTLEGEQQVVLKAIELLEKAEKEFHVYAPDEYLAQLYYGDFTDKLKNRRSKIEVSLLTGASPKSNYFLEQMEWPCIKQCEVEAQNLPCFMISDKKELLMVFHEAGASKEMGEKKKFKTVAIWTNYDAFVSTLQTLFSKMLWKSDRSECGFN